MKRFVLSPIAVVAFIFALSFPAAAPAAPPTPKPQPANAAPAAPEPHPEIRSAIAALRRARMHMQDAAHDFGGHRVEALKATDDAIRQLEICLQYDK